MLKKLLLNIGVGKPSSEATWAKIMEINPHEDELAQYFTDPRFKRLAFKAWANKYHSVPEYKEIIEASDDPEIKALAAASLWKYYDFKGDPISDCWPYIEAFPDAEIVADLVEHEWRYRDILCPLLAKIDPQDTALLRLAMESENCVDSVWARLKPRATNDDLLWVADKVKSVADEAADILISRRPSLDILIKIFCCNFLSEEMQNRLWKMIEPKMSEDVFYALSITYRSPYRLDEEIWSSYLPKCKPNNERLYELRGSARGNSSRFSDRIWRELVRRGMPAGWLRHEVQIRFHSPHATEAMEMLMGMDHDYEWFKTLEVMVQQGDHRPLGALCQNLAECPTEILAELSKNDRMDWEYREKFRHEYLRRIVA